MGAQKGIVQQVTLIILGSSYRYMALKLNDTGPMHSLSLWQLLTFTVKHLRLYMLQNFGSHMVDTVIIGVESIKDFSFLILTTKARILIFSFFVFL